MKILHGLTFPAKAKKASNVAVECIKRWEALSLKAYLPTKDDVPTIGWGHTRGVKMGDEIAVEEAESFLKTDVAEAERTLKEAVGEAPMTTLQYDALVSMTFNLGPQLWNETGIYKAVLAEDHTEVMRQMSRWVYQGKKKLLGLEKRREFERGIYFAGTVVWQD